MKSILKRKIRAAIRAQRKAHPSTLSAAVPGVGRVGARHAFMIFTYSPRLRLGLIQEPAWVSCNLFGFVPSENLFQLPVQSPLSKSASSAGKEIIGWGADYNILHLASFQKKNPNTPGDPLGSTVWRLFSVISEWKTLLKCFDEMPFRWQEILRKTTSGFYCSFQFSIDVSANMYL